MTMPYAMQMDKATRLISGLTNSRNLNDFVLGSQIKKYYVIKDKNWAFGDKLEISSWLQKSYDDSLAFSARLLFTKEQKISGSSSMIRSPVQSANPLNFGGRLFEFGLGANKVFNFFERKHSRVGIEILFALKNNTYMDTSAYHTSPTSTCLRCPSPTSLRTPNGGYCSSFLPWFCTSSS